MAAQLEDGFTQIAHTILEEMARAPFNGTQFNILLAIIRYTYGFKRKSHRISISYLTEATDRSRNQVKREMDKLIAMDVIKVFGQGSFIESREVGINKELGEWKLDDRTLKRVHPSNPSIPESTDREDSNPSTGGVPFLESQDIYLFKDNLKDKEVVDKDPYILILESFCELHKKAEYHLKPEERQAMHALLREGIAAEFIISTMKRIHQDKLSTGDTIKSFVYYPNAIRKAWTSIMLAQQEMAAGKEQTAYHPPQRKQNGFGPRKPKLAVMPPNVPGPQLSQEEMDEIRRMALKLDGKEVV